MWLAFSQPHANRPLGQISYAQLLSSIAWGETGLSPPRIRVVRAQTYECLMFPDLRDDIAIIWKRTDKSTYNFGHSLSELQVLSAVRIESLWQAAQHLISKNDLLYVNVLLALDANIRTFLHAEPPEKCSSFYHISQLPDQQTLPPDMLTELRVALYHAAKVYCPLPRYSGISSTVVKALERFVRPGRVNTVKNTSTLLKNPDVKHIVELLHKSFLLGNYALCIGLCPPGIRRRIEIHQQPPDIESNVLVTVALRVYFTAHLDKYPFLAPHELRPDDLALEVWIAKLPGCRLLHPVSLNQILSQPGPQSDPRPSSPTMEFLQAVSPKVKELSVYPPLSVVDPGNKARKPATSSCSKASAARRTRRRIQGCRTIVPVTKLLAGNHIVRRPRLSRAARKFVATDEHDAAVLKQIDAELKQSPPSYKKVAALACTLNSTSVARLGHIAHALAVASQLWVSEKDPAMADLQAKALANKFHPHLVSAVSTVQCCTTCSFISRCPCSKHPIKRNLGLSFNHDSYKRPSQRMLAYRTMRSKWGWVCMSCQNPAKPLDLLGRIARVRVGIGPKLRVVWVSLCCSCGILTELCGDVNGFPACPPCMLARESQNRKLKYPCICNLGMGQPITLKAPDGSLKPYGICSKAYCPPRMLKEYLEGKKKNPPRASVIFWLSAMYRRNKKKSLSSKRLAIH